jgi:hypothetical protein
MPNDMAKNLLLCMRDLHPKECNLIVGALNTFGPSKYRDNPLPYNDPIRLGFRLDPKDIKDVLAALHEVYSFQGTAAALQTARKLKRMCQQSKSSKP